ncbi:hypothetical protein HDU93_009751 [Gonapodya sp. JEL0774]|nr:hypothetical protein HDU93_009751 [Gonapodya sp. JEL0774]
MSSEYTGFVPAPNWNILRVNLEDLTPERFFSQFVATRTPVVIVGLLPCFGPEWKDPTALAALKVDIATSDLSDSVESGQPTSRKVQTKKIGDITNASRDPPIRSITPGDCIVQVETKVDGSFGSGKKRLRMTFRDLVQKLMNGDKNIYMTTQYGEEDETFLDADCTVLSAEDRETLHAVSTWCQPPLTHLLRLLDARPALLGELAPQQINMWLGRTDREGSSSGLHHDFADNLYALVLGQKHFSLFAPCDALNLYLAGLNPHVFSNGLITYKTGKRLTVRGDGARHIDVAKFKVHKCETRVAEIESKLSKTRKKTDKENLRAELEHAEEELESAMDALLEIQVGGSGNGKEIGTGLAADDDEDGEDGDEEDSGDFGDDVDEDFDFQDDFDALEGKDGDANTNRNNGASKRPIGMVASGAPDVHVPKPLPPSFSKIPANTLNSADPHALDQFPLARAATRVDCDLRAGEMLYLPAGWLHEVTSYGDNETDSTAPGLHMAINFWMHPPMAAKFERPYEDMYWSELWEDSVGSAFKVWSNKLGLQYHILALASRPAVTEGLETIGSMVKGKSRVLNPADALRKAQRKKELKKNKEERNQVRLVATATKDYSKAERELSHLRSQERQGLLDATGIARKRELEERLVKAKEARSKLGLDKDKEKKSSDKDKPKVLFELDVGKTLDGETLTKKKLLKSAKEKERDRKKEKAREEKEGIPGAKKRKRESSASDSESSSGSNESKDSGGSSDSESNAGSEDSEGSGGSAHSNVDNHGETVDHGGEGEVDPEDIDMDDLELDAIEVSYENLSFIPLPSGPIPEGGPYKKRFYEDLYLNETREKTSLAIPTQTADPKENLKESTSATQPRSSLVQGRDERERQLPAPGSGGRRGPPLPPQNSEWRRLQKEGNGLRADERPPPPPGPPPGWQPPFPPPFTANGENETHSFNSSFRSSSHPTLPTFEVPYPHQASHPSRRSSSRLKGLSHR